jgi:tetratricopeptide (TPR) repeat protein
MMTRLAWLAVPILLAAPSFARQQRGQPESQYQPAAIREEVTGAAFDHIQRGNKLMQEGRFDKAISEFRYAIERAEKPIRTPYVNLGAAFLAKKDYESAVMYYTKALDMKPDDQMVRFYLAQSLQAAGQYREAEAHYRNMIYQSGGINPPAHHGLGRVLFERRLVDAAITEYSIALGQSGGNYPRAHYDLAVALLARGDAASAERELRLAVEQEKKDWPEAHFHLGEAIEKQGRFREAADEYEVYLRLSPDSPDSAKLRDYVTNLRRKQ